MRLPRDVAGRDLAVSLTRLGYAIDRQTGSHIRLTTKRGGEHHVTIPDHDPLRPGTLNAILRDVGAHAKLPREELLRLLFGQGLRRRLGPGRYPPRPMTRALLLVARWIAAAHDRWRAEVARRGEVRYLGNDRALPVLRLRRAA